jgi:hypothetical protein
MVSNVVADFGLRPWEVSLPSVLGLTGVLLLIEYHRALSG